MTESLLSFESLIAELRAVAEIFAVTALRYRPDGAERIYSSHPESFSDSGFKHYADAPTMARVRESEGPVLSDGIEALKDGFTDWQNILSHGCDAVVNLPVRISSGATVGQLNLMGKSGSYSEETLSRLQAITNNFAECFIDTPRKERSSCVCPA